MNDIFGDQASMTFVNSGINSRLTVLGLGSQVAGVSVRVTQFGSTPDTSAIKANRNRHAVQNVFFVGKFITLPGLDGIPPISRAHQPTTERRSTLAVSCPFFVMLNRVTPPEDPGRTRLMKQGMH